MKASTPWKIMVFSCLAVFLIIPDAFGEVIFYTGKGMIQFVWNLLPVFLCVGLMDAWIEKEEMVKMIGEASGIPGKFLSLFMGMLTAVPIYALLPIAGLLVKKGGRVSNVLIFLCSSVSIRIPLLLFEAASLGWRFSVCRFLLNLPVVFIIGGTIERLLSEKEASNGQHL